jgi:hypothetical protein
MPTSTQNWTSTHGHSLREEISWSTVLKSAGIIIAVVLALGLIGLLVFGIIELGHPVFTIIISFPFYLVF